MIDEARERVNTSNSSLSIQYIVSDAKVLDKIDEFGIHRTFLSYPPFTPLFSLFFFFFLIE